MYLKSIELSGFKSFGKKTAFLFGAKISAIVGPNGSGKCVTGDTLLWRRRRSDIDYGKEEEFVEEKINTGEDSSSATERRVKESSNRPMVKPETVVSQATSEILSQNENTALSSDAFNSMPRESSLSDRTSYAGSVANPTWMSSEDRGGVENSLVQPPEGVEPSRHGLRSPVRHQADGLSKGYHAINMKAPAGWIYEEVPIIEIREGDEIASLDEKTSAIVCARVKTLINSGEKPIYKLTTAGGKSIRTTAEHPYFVAKSRYGIMGFLAGEDDMGPAYSGSVEVGGNLRRGVFRPRMSVVSGSAPYSTISARVDSTALPVTEKTGEWRLISEISKGDRIAATGPSTNTNGVIWDEVISLELLPSEQVYDVEIEGTHNFIGNGIVAHNSNVAEGFRFVLGEQSMKSMRSKRGEDLIWGGSPALPRMNRAVVKVVFDNSPGRSGKRLLDIDFPEVVVERIVHRDGQNEYLLNGSQVRLKDVIRLLAGANIGGSGYQIISQGEADRILNASPKERREMVEDALGLKLYQHKKAESERKLEETAVNIEKTKSLRREIAPHLKFLQVQVEKIEKAREMKDELADKLREYLARENAWITASHARISDELKEIEEHIRDFESKLKDIRKAKGGKSESGRDDLFKQLEALQHELSDARRKREDVVRELGRAEGALEATNVTVEAVVPAPYVREFAREITEAISEAEHSNDIGALKGLLVTLRNRIKAFVDGLSGAAPLTNKETKDNVERLSTALKKAEGDESRLFGETEKVRAEMTRVREASFVAEKEEVEVEAKLREAQSKMISVKAEREHVSDQKRRFDEEVREGVALAGLAMQSWDREVPEGALSEDRGEQEKRRRAIERLKIKIEEADAGGGDVVVKEYRQTQERDIFLAKELEDLEKSAASLQDIIVELEKTIDARFTEGLKHINEALGTFFQKLFGGGSAKLFVEEPKRMSRRRLDMGEMEESDIPDEEELYAGLSIDVSLPRKKIRGLEVLSGGERALTSIALIFSMSQVNPPPFLILDETDAALDEANSKRYADMIIELGKKSQLIVITHNRATMSAAGELYGVTMGQDGVSKVLSVKLQEAEQVAK